MLSLLSTYVVRIVVVALVLVGDTTAFAAGFLQRIAPCLACHGETGQSEKPEVPSLGAQPVNFLLIQIYMFREKLRQVEPMTTAAQGLSDEELRQFSAFTPSCRRRIPALTHRMPREWSVVAPSHGSITARSATSQIFPVASRCRG